MTPSPPTVVTISSHDVVDSPGVLEVNDCDRQPYESFAEYTGRVPLYRDSLDQEHSPPEHALQNATSTPSIFEVFPIPWSWVMTGSQQPDSMNGARSLLPSALHAGSADMQDDVQTQCGDIASATPARMNPFLNFRSESDLESLDEDTTTFIYN